MTTRLQKIDTLATIDQFPNEDIAAATRRRVEKFLSHCYFWVNCKAVLAYSNKNFQVNIILHKYMMGDAILQMKDSSGNSCYLPINPNLIVKFNTNYISFSFPDTHNSEIVFAVENTNRQFEFLVSQIRICRIVSQFREEFNFEQNESFLNKYAKPSNFDLKCELFDIMSSNTITFPIPYIPDAFQTWSERSHLLNSSFFTNFYKFRIMCMTWNVGSGHPDDDVENQIKTFINGDYDILFFAFQEIDMSFQTVVSGNSEARSEWTKVLTSAFIEDGRYNLVHSISLGGVFSAVGVRKKILDSFDNPVPINVHPPEQVRLGFHGKLANKSAIIYTVDVGYNGHLMLVGCHLAAHQESSDARNQMLIDLMKHMKNTTDYFILIGDLNYRIDLKFEDVISKIEKGDLKTLKLNDQLMKARASNSDIYQLTEGVINFNPTYKFDVGYDRYDTGPKHRIPSYTDRVLCRKREECRMSVNKDEQFVFETDIAADLAPKANVFMTDQCYTSKNIVYNYPMDQVYETYTSGTCKISDHRPVKGVIAVDIPVMNPEKNSEFKTRLLEKVEEMKSLATPRFIPGSQTITMKVKETMEFEFKNESYAWAQWSLQFDESSSPKLCRVTPTQGIVLPGHTFKLRISGKKKTPEKKPVYLKLVSNEGMLAQLTIVITK